MDLTGVPEYVMNTLCRICAEKSSVLVPIFRDDSLPYKIGKCLLIKVSKTDDLPLNVCEPCLLRIDESYSLYQTAHKSNDRLIELWKILINETLQYYPEIIHPLNSASNCQPEVPDSESVKLNANSDVMSIGKSVVLEIVNKSNGMTSQSGSIENSCKKNPVEVDQCYGTITAPTNKIKLFNKESPRPEKTESRGKVFQCQYCFRQLTSSASLSLHESTHSQRRPFLCDTCGKSFKHSNNLRCHTRTHSVNKKKHACRICDKEFATGFFLREHMHSHTGETPYKCEVCKKEFKEKVHLRQHKWTHSSEKFSCPMCSSKFSRKGNMSEHIKKYHRKPTGESNENKGGPGFNCSVCSQQFSSQILLKNHVKVHSEKKFFSCSICGKKFGHSGSLTYHRRTVHTGEKPFGCTYCNESFSLRSVQKIHERKVHTFERPYKCTFCPQTFSNSSSLTNHLYIHSTDKMFECGDCGKKFSRNSNLMVHKKIHTGERRFACDHCTKTYIQKHDLLKHLRSHDPKSKPFFCKYCGNRFSHKKDSTKHATCQFDYLRKSNSDTWSAEKMLDSVSVVFQQEEEDEAEEERDIDRFFREKEQLILASNSPSPHEPQSTEPV